jgi:hypothetical protein
VLDALQGDKIPSPFQEGMIVMLTMVGYEIRKRDGLVVQRDLTRHEMDLTDGFVDLAALNERCGVCWTGLWNNCRAVREVVILRFMKFCCRQNRRETEVYDEVLTGHYSVTDYRS